MSGTTIGCLVAGGVAIFLAFLFFIFGSFVTVGVGEVGIVRSFGAIDTTNPQTFGPGVHLKMPFKDDVVYFDTKIQRADVEKIQAASKDGITVETHLVVNYHIVASAAPLILQQVGTAYVERILSPALQQSYKDVSGTYSALEMIQNRQKFADEAQKNLSAKVAPFHLLIDSLAVVNIDFPQSFDDALQATQVANQNRLKVIQEQETAKTQAETARIQAEGLAAAQKAQAVSITEEYLRLQALQKWNGVLPQYLSPGAVLPFIGNSATPPTTTPAPSK